MPTSSDAATFSTLVGVCLSQLCPASRQFLGEQWLCRGSTPTHRPVWIHRLVGEVKCSTSWSAIERRLVCTAVVQEDLQVFSDAHERALMEGVFETKRCVVSEESF